QGLGRCTAWTATRRWGAAKRLSRTSAALPRLAGEGFLLSAQDDRHLVEGGVGRFELRLRVPGPAEPGVVDQDRVRADADDCDRVLGERVPDAAAVIGREARERNAVVRVADPGDGGMALEYRLIHGLRADPGAIEAAAGGQHVHPAP